jgi:hypothetical protein
VWLVVAVLGSMALPWETVITSNGYRFLLLILLAFLSVRVAVGVLGAAPEPLRRPEPPSPDLIGIDRPLTRSDAMDAARALGIDEAELSGAALAGGVR